MILKNTLIVSILFTTLTYATTSTKFFPMPTSDGLVVILPYEDIENTKPSKEDLLKSSNSDGDFPLESTHNIQTRLSGVKILNKIIITQEDIGNINDFIIKKYPLIELNSLSITKQNSSYIISYNLNKINDKYINYEKLTGYINDTILFKIQNKLNVKIKHKIFKFTINNKDVKFEASNIDTHQRRLSGISNRTNSKKLVFLNPGHGLTRKDNNTDSWRYQRDYMNGMREDYKNIEIVSHLYPKLKKYFNLKVSRPLQNQSNLDDIPQSFVDKSSAIGDSGYLMYEENARQFIKKIIPAKTDIWDFASSGKYEDKDINSRAFYSNYLNPTLMLSIHTNGSKANEHWECYKKGTKVYYSDNSSKEDSLELSQVLADNISQRIQEKYDSDWADAEVISQFHAENYYSKKKSAIVEVAYHDCPSDAKALNDAVFLDIVTDGITESINSYTRTSYLDGVGSLINPIDKCWGCQHDEAKMHPHSIPSTVAFQWKAVPNICPYINIGVAKSGSVVISNEKMDVVVKHKMWATNTEVEAYNTTLPVTVLNNGLWNNTAITTINNLSSEKRIIAECSKSNTYKISNSDIINENNLRVKGGYYWGGNGSLISTTSNTSAQGSSVGNKLDYTISFFKQKKNLSVFQWRPSKQCEKIYISLVDDDAVDFDNIATKFWSKKTWTDNQCQNKLPCTISTTKYNDDTYFLIKIENSSNEFDSDQIKVKCK